MAKMNKTTRKNCQQANSSISVPPTSPRNPQTIVDTRQTRLICAAECTAGKIPRKQLFKAYGVSESTGYRILKSKSIRRSNRVHNRGRKSVFAPHQCDAIEAVENSSFQFGTLPHITIARTIGLANGSERAIQRNMTKHGVDTYITQQKKFISANSIEKRGIWGFERRY